MRLIRFFYFPLIIALGLTGCAKLPSTSAPNTTNRTAHRIHSVLPKYASIANESWRPIHAKLPLKVGSTSAAVSEIRHRLIVLGDLSKGYASKSERFDSALEHAVKQFQWRHGMRLTGIVDQGTLNALNVDPAHRYRQLVSSMNKWSELPEDMGSHYVHVNVPNFKMYLIDKGQRVMDMKVVAGRPGRATPTLYSKVKTIVFNPTWTVPKTILAEDVIPGMRKNPNYMKEHYNMKLYASWKRDAPEIDPLTIDWHKYSGATFPYRITAPPGDENPLGRVKFIFENEHDVYLHGTPTKSLFNRIERAYSSGCIRLEKPFDLVSYYFDDNSDLSPEHVNQYLSSGKTKYIQLKNPVPIYITYITSWVDENGKVHFREDIYDKYNKPNASHS